MVLFGLLTLGAKVNGESPDDLLGDKAYVNHPRDQSHDVLLIVETVGVAFKSAACIHADLVLVDDPLQRGSIAKLVVEGLWRNPTERKKAVANEAAFVGAEPHLFNPPVEGSVLALQARKWEFRALIVVDMQFRQGLARLHEGAKFRSVWNTGQFTF